MVKKTVSVYFSQKEYDQILKKLKEGEKISRSIRERTLKSFNVARDQEMEAIKKIKKEK